MLFTSLFVPREVSEATNACYLQHFVTPGMGRTAKEATNACYLQHFGSSVWYRIKEAKNACYLQYFWPRRKYRRPRLYAIYSTLGPQGGIGGHDCMLFTTRLAPMEVSEATIVCYLRHFGPPGRYRTMKFHKLRPQVKGYIHRSRTDAASAFLNMYGLLQPWS